MKIKHFRLLLITTIVLVIALLFWWRATQRAVSSTPVIASPIQTNHTPNSVSVSNTTALIHSNSTAFVDTNRLIRNQIAQLEEFAQTYNKYHNIPIDFYGKIIDQDSNPVVGVKIDVTIRQQYVISAILRTSTDKEIPLNVVSGQNGCFVIHGKNGDSVHIDSIQKDGYRLSPKVEKTYAYVSSIEPFHPDSQNPVIIKMWKLGESANLISHRTLFGFRPGRIYTLDILTDKKIENGSANGDLRIQFERQSVLTPREAYPWSLEISAVDGGLVETTDEFEYVAPESGYQPQISFQTNSISPKAVPDITKDYYFTSRNGRVYGVVSLQIFSDYNGQSAILVNSRINSNGSRDLQP